MNSQNIGLFLVCLTVSISMCDAECCGSAGNWPNMTCNGVGPCNLLGFCCNCDGGCKRDYPSLKMREPGFKIPSEDPEKLFAEIDTNNDKVITFAEAVDSIVKHGGEKAKFEKDRTWFTSIDTNGDGKIQPSEMEATFKH